MDAETYVKNGRDTIEIACNIDEGYTKYCAVMLVSLFDNNRDERFHVHIIADRLSDFAQDTLREITGRFGHAISFYFDLKYLLKDCSIPESSHISIATYYRCFLDLILPASIQKVLYLDSDMIIRGSVRELWDTDLTGYPLAAVEDMWSGRTDYARLGYDPGYSYFNAGVLLINLDEWRKEGINRKAAEEIVKGRDTDTFFDQDVLNRLFHATKLFLPFYWNMQDGFFRKKRKIRKEAWGALNQALKKTVVVHFTGSKKPWHYHSFHPYKAFYNHYLDQTRWKGERPPVSMRDFCKKNMHRISVMFGLANGYRAVQ